VDVGAFDVNRGLTSLGEGSYGQVYEVRVWMEGARGNGGWCVLSHSFFSRVGLGRPVPDSNLLLSYS